MSATISLRRPVPVRGRSHGVVRGPVPAAPRSDSSRPVARAASEATYRRRRAVVGTVLAVVVAIGVVSAYDVVSTPGGSPASAVTGEVTRGSVVVLPGDTLWSIAERHHGEISITRYVDKLVALNGGPSIIVGQTVVLP